MYNGPAALQSRLPRIKLIPHRIGVSCAEAQTAGGFGDAAAGILFSIVVRDRNKGQRSAVFIDFQINSSGRIFGRLGHIDLGEIAEFGGGGDVFVTDEEQTFAAGKFFQQFSGTGGCFGNGFFIPGLADGGTFVLDGDVVVGNKLIVGEGDQREFFVDGVDNGNVFRQIKDAESGVEPDDLHAVVDDDTGGAAEFLYPAGLIHFEAAVDDDVVVFVIGIGLLAFGFHAGDVVVVTAGVDHAHFGIFESLFDHGGFAFATFVGDIAGGEDEVHFIFIELVDHGGNQLQTAAVHTAEVVGEGSQMRVGDDTGFEEKFAGGNLLSTEGYRLFHGAGNRVFRIGFKVGKSDFTEVVVNGFFCAVTQFESALGRGVETIADSRTFSGDSQ